jgi:hypothetical protein
MKKVIYSLLICLTLTSLYSCNDKDSYDDSKITYYATLELKGETSLMWSKGVAYVDPGYTAELRGEDVTSEVVVNGTVDINTPGVYPLTYVITNADGYSVTKNRTVYVADPTVSNITSGIWKVTSASYRTYKGATATFGSDYGIVILQTSPGQFYISDFLAGWYDQKVGYGSSYAAVGSFTLNTDNTITMNTSSVAGWGDELSSLTNGVYNPTTGNITYVAGYVGDAMKFYVTLTKE